MRTPSERRAAYVERLRAILARPFAERPNDAAAALALVLGGRKAAERHARTELDYAFVDDDRAWARERILSPNTRSSRPDAWLVGIAGDALVDKWSTRLDLTDVHWLVLQLADLRSPTALALALRLHTEHPETRTMLTARLFERPQVQTELQAALEGPSSEAARSLLTALERRRLERLGESYDRQMREIDEDESLDDLGDEHEHDEHDEHDDDA
jgi:hypothetical protein